MDVVLPKYGSYVVAVSGGVDSMALLRLLHEHHGLELIVAHFDHGIRPDSAEDRKLVQKTAESYDLPFVCREGKLGAGTSEAKARAARYDFLRLVRKSHEAKAIITAHHQDDVLETIIINLLRGTGRKGLTSLKNQADILRPLLDISKAELVDYAKNNNLEWREDPTNLDTSYLRNYVRHKILPRFTARDRSELVRVHTNSVVTNRAIDAALDKLLETQISYNNLDRRWFNSLSHDVAREVMTAWLRTNQLRDFDRKTIERLVVAAKTGRAGKTFPVLGSCTMAVEKDNLALAGAER